MNTPQLDMTTNPVELTIEVHSANGSSAEFYQADEESVRETLRMLSSPQIFAQRHLVLASQHCASVLPCKGIDMILARTLARSSLKFPLNLPLGVFDIVEQPGDSPEIKSATVQDEDEPKRPHSHRRNAQVKIMTLGGSTVTLKAVGLIRGNIQDERQLFSHLPDMPTIPFRLEEGGFGLINTANIICASAWPKPEALTGITLPVELRGWTPSQTKNAAEQMRFS